MGFWQDLREALQGCETLDDVKAAVAPRAEEEAKREEIERIANSFTSED